MVTHDYADAIAIADRIGVLVEGKLVQLGTASELLTSPATPFVGVARSEESGRGSTQGGACQHRPTSDFALSVACG